MPSANRRCLRWLTGRPKTARSLTILLFAALLTPVGPFVSCGGDDSPAPSCTAGATIACFGPGACEGAQICLADGSAYGQCDCGTATTSTSGTTGVGGSGGAGGSGGSDCGADLQGDPLHCGACFNPCAPSQSCEAGACVCELDPTPPSFAGDVLPIFASKCTNEMCHQLGGSKSLSLLAMDAYSQLVNVPSSKCDEPRARVAPGKPEASFLVDKMLGVRLCSSWQMPLDELLPNEETAKVARWICAGAADD